MNHEQAFLQAIRETPQDDAPRLIYADWLEEQGGAARAARANFIRIQCRLDELPEDDPIRDRLEDEAANLLAEYEGEWTQPLHGIAEDWRFSRGFLEYLRIRGDNLLSHTERLFDFAPLRSLHLLISRNDIPRLAASPQLQWVSTLDFSRCQLNDRALQQLLTSPHLKRLNALNLDGNDINTNGMQTLIHSPIFARLTHLDLSRCRGIGDRVARLVACASEAVNLRHLSLAHSNVTSAGLRELFQSSHLTSLTALDIAGARFMFFEGEAAMRSLIDSRLLGQLRYLDLSGAAHPPSLRLLLASPQVARLQALYLRGLIIDGAATQMLAESLYLANLTVLDLARANLGSAAVQALAGSPYLASLTHLNISHNNIRDKGARAIAKSPYLIHLRVLNLDGNGIGGPGLKALAESSNIEHLTTLHLGSNFIGADSVRALAESAHLRKLACLDLSDAVLEEDSARALASSANLARLRTLLLSKNSLGDGGARALAQSPHLTRLATLDLNDNRIGKAGAEALAAASWRRLRSLDLRGNVFTDTQEASLRQRFGNAVQL